MNVAYFRIIYSVPNYRSAKTATILVCDDGLSRLEMKNIAINKLYKHLGAEVKILDCYKLPSNYKAQDTLIIK